MPPPTLSALPYGSWKSPITSELIVSQSIGLAEVELDNDQIYWWESRPQENGRHVIVRRSLGGGATFDVLPPPYSARTRVHEYGGGAWTVDNGVLYFSNDQPGKSGEPSDQRLYRQVPPNAPEPLTAAGDMRYADGIIDRTRQRWIGIREDHTTGQQYPENAIVAVDVSTSGLRYETALVSGHDFFAAPRMAPDGRKLAWLAWDHPNMPWVGTRLYIDEIGPNGRPSGAPMVVAGGRDQSVMQPQWAPDGASICFVCDRTGWWNLYNYDLRTRATRQLAPMSAEFGHAQWSLGMSSYAFADRDRIVASYVTGGFGYLGVVDVSSGHLEPLELPYREFRAVHASGNYAVFCAGAPDTAASIVVLDIVSRRLQLVKKATEVGDDPEIRRYFSQPQPMEFPTEDEKTAFAIYYPPANPDYIADTTEKPPLIVRCHGGPTSAAATTLNLGIQYWTSRGVAVLDVNYGGSTGYGREYRDRLHLKWGIVDVDDSVNGAKFLVKRGLADPGRLVIAGGSAGGYTCLAVLTFRDTFQGGASYYGVSDLAALAKDTHKFESHYLEWLIGPYPQAKASYEARSPLYHAEHLSKPVIFFQGEDDAVVPPQQTELMVEALRRKGIAVGYLLFSGEQHGFRRASNIKRALDAELYFYAFEVFGTKLAF